MKSLGFEFGGIVISSFFGWGLRYFGIGMVPIMSMVLPCKFGWFFKRNLSGLQALKSNKTKHSTLFKNIVNNTE